jgi:hypothetical protein
MRDLPLAALERVGVEVLDPRTSHRQFRCRQCSATWRPSREISGLLRRQDWVCWRGCNSAATLSGSSRPTLDWPRKKS